MSRSGSTAPARSLVPPRSTPITQRAGTSTTIPRSPWPTRSPPTPNTARAPSCSAGRAPTARATRIDDLRGGVPRPEDPDKRRLRERFTFWRVLGYIGAFVVGWLLLSLLLFLISAQVQRQGVDDAAGTALEGLRLHAHLAQHDPRARLRRAQEGHEGARREHDRPAEPLRHDHAHARRRREVRAPLDPARHDRRHPRPRPRQDQRRLRLRRPGPRHQDRLAVPRASTSTTSSRSTSRTSPPSSTRSAASTTAAAASSSASTAAPATAATRCACKRGENHLDGEQALALARTRKNECNPARERPHARAPPAEDPRRDQGPADQPEDVLPPPARLLERRRRRSARTWPAPRCSACSARSRRAAHPTPACCAATRTATA